MIRSFRTHLGSSERSSRSNLSFFSLCLSLPPPPLSLSLSLSLRRKKGLQRGVSATLRALGTGLTRRVTKFIVFTHRARILSAGSKTLKYASFHVQLHLAVSLACSGSSGRSGTLLSRDVIPWSQKEQRKVRPFRTERRGFPQRQEKA